jgi:hypothetical protein
MSKLPLTRRDRLHHASSLLATRTLAQILLARCLWFLVDLSFDPKVPHFSR